MRLDRWPWLVAAASLVLYLALSLDHLRVFPPIGEDEPWIAAAPAKLAAEGVYGSDLFAGYYGVERHNYQHMPVYPLLEAGVFKVFGVGVLQMRILPVTFGLALLCAVFVAGREIGGARTGAVAVVVMIGLRIAATTEGSGVLLLDRARISRYDIAVPVFGLLAVTAFCRGLRDDRARWWALAGALTALASLSHLFGVFWLPVLLMALVVLPGARKWAAAFVLVAAFAATCVPWALFVATGWSDYLGQMRFVSSRFDLFSPAFYVANVLNADGPLSVVWLARQIATLSPTRVGAWTAVLGIPVAVTVMFRRGIVEARAPLVVVALAAVMQFVMFVALLQVKTVNYMIGLWPLGALLIAWLAIWLWDCANRPGRLALAALAGMIVLEAAIGIGRARADARAAMSYEAYTADIARCIPAGSRVLGLQHYWLGLRQFDYRTWLVPINLTSPRYFDRPMPLDAALDVVDPDVILIDRFMAAFFAAALSPQHPSHRAHVEFTAFMTRRHAEPACAIQSRTYGPMQVHILPRR